MNPPKIEQSPSWERSRDAVRRQIKKRKSSSKCLSQMFEQESLSMLECSAESSSILEVSRTSQAAPAEPPLQNILNTQSNRLISGGGAKRVKHDGPVACSSTATTTMRVIDWGEASADRMLDLSLDEADTLAARGVTAPPLPLPLDWDDSEARSAFDAPQLGAAPTTSSSSASAATANCCGTRGGSAALNKTISSVYPVDFSHLNAFGGAVIAMSRRGAGANNYKPNCGGGAGGSILGAPAGDTPARCTSERQPHDLRLGTRVRLLSDQPFPWLSAKQSQTTGNYAVQMPDADFLDAMNFGNSKTDDEALKNFPPRPTASLATLQRAALYHQFPSIGTVQLFPRRAASMRSNALLKSANLQNIEANFMRALGTQWAQSLHNLLHVWLSGQCTEFYVCAPQFTALFISTQKFVAKRRSSLPKSQNQSLTKTPQKQQNTNLGLVESPKQQQNVAKRANSNPSTPTTLLYRWATRAPTSATPTTAKKSEGRKLEAKLGNGNNAKSPRKKASPLKMATNELKMMKSSPSKGSEEAAKMGSKQQHHMVVITPTTSGFRQTLTKNGIGFTLPFKAATEFVELDQEDCPKDFLPSAGDDSVGMDHDEWLRDIGISPRATLRMKRSASEFDVASCSTGGGADCRNVSTAAAGGKSMSQRVVLPNAANRNNNSSASGVVETSKSTVIISGSFGADAFCRLLIAQPALCSTKTGPQAGLPPTLLAPRPFRHSAHRELSMTSQVLKKQGKARYTLELEHGPMMPSTIEMLVEFVRFSLPRPNRVQLQVGQRNQCSGLNEAVAAEVGDEQLQKQITNIAELELYLRTAAAVADDQQQEGDVQFSWT